MNQKSLFLKRRAREKHARNKTMKDYLTTMTLKGKNRLSDILRNYVPEPLGEEAEPPPPPVMFIQMEPRQTEGQWKKDEEESEAAGKVPIHHTQHHFFHRVRVKTEQSSMQSSLQKSRPSNSVDKPVRPETLKAAPSETPHSVKKEQVAPYPRSPRSPKRDYRALTGLGRLESQNRMWCKIQTKSLNFPKKEDEITPWDRIQGSDLSVLI